LTCQVNAQVSKKEAGNDEWRGREMVGSGGKVVGVKRFDSFKELGESRTEEPKL